MQNLNLVGGREAEKYNQDIQKLKNQLSVKDQELKIATYKILDFEKKSIVVSWHHIGPCFDIKDEDIDKPQVQTTELSSCPTTWLHDNSKSYHPEIHNELKRKKNAHNTSWESTKSQSSRTKGSLLKPREESKVVIQNNSKSIFSLIPSPGSETYSGRNDDLSAPTVCPPHKYFDLFTRYCTLI